MNKKILYSAIATIATAAMADFTTWFGDTEKVETGLDNATATGGYWFDYNDSADKGLSEVQWPVAKGTEWDKNSLQFMHYETLWYIVGFVEDELRRRIS